MNLLFGETIPGPVKIFAWYVVVLCFVVTLAPNLSCSMHSGESLAALAIAVLCFLRPSCLMLLLAFYFFNFVFTSLLYSSSLLSDGLSCFGLVSSLTRRESIRFSSIPKSAFLYVHSPSNCINIRSQILQLLFCTTRG